MRDQGAARRVVGSKGWDPAPEPGGWTLPAAGSGWLYSSLHPPKAQSGGNPPPAPSQKLLLFCLGAPALLNKSSSVLQHGGVRGPVHTAGHHGERAVQMPGQPPAPEKQVWQRLHLAGQNTE